MTSELWGSVSFGLVVGWVTYRTLRRTETSGLSDIATVVGVVGGGVVTTLFPQSSAMFGAYGIGLAIGFFAYFIVSLLVASNSGADGLNAVNEWLGETPGSTTRPRVPGLPERSQPDTGGVPPIP